MADVIQEIVFTEAEFQEVYDDVAMNFRDASYRSELDDFNDAIYESHADRFALENDPNLSAWPPLAAATIARKGHDTILVDTERLRRSLTTKGHEDHTGEITDRGLTFGTDVPYSRFQKRRAHVGLTTENVEELTAVITKSASDKLRKVA